MADFDNPSSLDEQLRSVALPPGLLDRLRAVTVLGDSAIDDAAVDDAAVDRALSDVPVPVELLARLREIATLGDAELNHRLRDVPVPEGLLEELRLIGSLAEPDLDAALRDVPLPLGMRPRLGRNVRWQTQRTQWIGLAVAASLLITVSIVGWLISTQHGSQQAGVEPKADNHILASQVDRRNGANKPNSIPASSNIAAKTPEENGSGTHVANIPATDGSQHKSIPASNGSGLADGSSPQAPNSLTKPANVEAVFGGQIDPPPDLNALVPDLVNRGLSGPRVKQYDLAFELLHGVHPFVNPAASPLLRECRVPTETSTASYDLAGRMLQAGAWPIASQIRVEDFLAAQDFQFPAPSGADLGIRTAAGPSPVSGLSMSLLQVGLQAAGVIRNPDSATHLTIIVDGSSDMRADERWELVGRALERLSQQLTAADRVSLVVAGLRSEVLLSRGGRAELEHVLSGWRSVMHGGPANMAAAVAAATELAPGPAEGKTPERRTLQRAVVLTGGLLTLESQSLAQTKQRIAAASAAGAQWDVVNIRQDELYDESWLELAAVSGHPVRHAASEESLYQRLLEALAGRSQVVAGSVSLKVVFDPEAVARYRLVGHEATGPGGLSGGPLEADLRAGQAATALFEVELKPDGAQHVATVEVAWREPGVEQIHRLKQEVVRLQFAPSWREAALPLQLATLAAATAEVLRGSYFAPAGVRGLDQVAELVDQANPQLTLRPSYVRLKQFLERARRASHASGMSAAREMP